jgi:flavin reductase (DIM6/NTAB) family NADH-FMN oxidoreductase RutF
MTAVPGSHAPTVGSGIEPSSASEYRDLMSAFPSGVAVVTASGPDAEPHGMTCTSLSSVTLHPPTLLVCLGLRSGTLAALRRRGSFAVNLLHSRAVRAAEVFSSTASGRFRTVQWRPSTRIGAPWLWVDAFAVAECAVRQEHVFADHAVVFGAVVNVVNTAGVPLVYGHRQYSAWVPSLWPATAACRTSDVNCPAPTSEAGAG